MLFTSLARLDRVRSPIPSTGRPAVGRFKCRRHSAHVYSYGHAAVMVRLICRKVDDCADRTDKRTACIWSEGGREKSATPICRSFVRPRQRFGTHYSRSSDYRRRQLQDAAVRPVGRPQHATRIITCAAHRCPFIMNNRQDTDLGRQPVPKPSYTYACLQLPYSLSRLLDLACMSLLGRSPILLLPANNRVCRASSAGWRLQRSSRPAELGAKRASQHSGKEGSRLNVARPTDRL